MAEHFKSDTFRRPDGRWVFVATEGPKTYEFVHADKFTPFTEHQLLSMKVEAMRAFDGVQVIVPPPNHEWCSKHNLKNPCPVCADRFVIWELVRMLGGFGSAPIEDLRAKPSRHDVAGVLRRVENGN